MSTHKTLPKNILSFLKEELTDKEFIAFEKDRIVMISAASLRKLIDVSIESCYEGKAMTKEKAISKLVESRLNRTEVIQVTEENMKAVLLGLKILDRLLS